MSQSAMPLEPVNAAASTCRPLTAPEVVGDRLARAVAQGRRHGAASGSCRGLVELDADADASSCVASASGVSILRRPIETGAVT